jgi:putative glutamine amidotransferase
MSMPLVGLTAWRGEFPTYAGPQTLDTLETTYSQAVIAAGMSPLIIPNGQAPESAPEVVARVDCLVLTGGSDIDPEMYGNARRRVEEDDIEVDRFEVALVRAARSANKPVLAICRGLQLLNVALGGTLNQDVASPETAHEPIEDGYDPEELERRRHPVLLTTHGILSRVYGSTEIKVNSMHHQGIETLPDDLIAEGHAPDGLIEAARYRGSWWAVGIQWHPERLPADERDPIFTELRQVVTAG